MCEESSGQFEKSQVYGLIEPSWNALYILRSCRRCSSEIFDIKIFFENYYLYDIKVYTIITKFHPIARNFLTHKCSNFAELLKVFMLHGNCLIRFRDTDNKTLPRGIILAINPPLKDSQWYVKRIQRNVKLEWTHQGNCAKYRRENKSLCER